MDNKLTKATTISKWLGLTAFPPFANQVRLNVLAILFSASGDVPQTEELTTKYYSYARPLVNHHRDESRGPGRWDRAAPAAP